MSITHESASTSGPWQMFESGRDRWTVYRGVMGTSTVQAIGHLEGLKRADAVLSIAAPELLAALIAAVKNHCADDKMFCSTCMPARATIAKATGMGGR